MFVKLNHMILFVFGESCLHCVNKIFIVGFCVVNDIFVKLVIFIRFW